MKKKSIVYLLSIAVLIVSLAGCSSKPYVTYLKAMEKTEAVESGKTKINVDVVSEFDYKNLSAEDISELKKFEKISVENITKFESENVNNLTNIKIGDLGYDVEYHKFGDKEYIYMPMIAKYIEIGENDTIMKNPIETLFDDEFQEKIVEIFKEQINIENTLKGNTIILETAEGQIKTVEYSVVLGKEEIKLLIDKIFEEYKNNEIEKGNTKDIEKIEEFISKIEIESFDYKGYVNKDNYINREVIEILYKTSEATDIVNQKIVVSVEQWDFNEKQDIKELTIPEGMLMNVDELDGGMDNYFNDGSFKLDTNKGVK